MDPRRHHHVFCHAEATEDSRFFLPNSRIAARTQFELFGSVEQLCSGAGASGALSSPSDINVANASFAVVLVNATVAIAGPYFRKQMPQNLASHRLSCRAGATFKIKANTKLNGVIITIVKTREPSDLNANVNDI